MGAVVRCPFDALLFIYKETERSHSPKGGRKQAGTEFGALFFLLGLISHVSKQRVRGELQRRLCCLNSHPSSCFPVLDACVSLPFTFFLAGSMQEMRLIKN